MSPCDPLHPSNKPGRRGTPVHHLGAGRAETAERRVKELETENATLLEAAGSSHATADWHGPLVAAERRVAELEAVIAAIPEWDEDGQCLFGQICIGERGREPHDPDCPRHAIRDALTEAPS